MKSNIEEAAKAEQARVASWAQKDASTQAHFDETQKAREADEQYYHNEVWERTKASYKADKASAEAMIANAEAEDKADAEAKAKKLAEFTEKARYEAYEKQYEKDYIKD